MKIMILGADGYLGWPTSVDLSSKNHKLLLIDNFTKKNLLKEYNRQPLLSNKPLNTRIKFLNNKNVIFKNINCSNYIKFSNAFKAFKPDAVIHYAELPSAPYSMLGHMEGWKTIENNLKSTFNLINCIKNFNPNCHVIKLGTMGEYGTPLSGRPIFEVVFPPDATLHWDDREWSLGGELTPRDPSCLYHVSKVLDTINVFEACKWLNLRSPTCNAGGDLVGSFLRVI